MATVQQFEDLICWQRARELTKFIYDISKYFRYIDMSKYREDRGLQDQIRRAAVSVMSNIAEGFERATKFELINYFYIAKGSCGEVKSGSKEGLQFKREKTKRQAEADRFMKEIEEKYPLKHNRTEE